jgi:hypothetical protein
MSKVLLMSRVEHTQTVPVELKDQATGVVTRTEVFLQGRSRVTLQPGYAVNAEWLASNAQSIALSTVKD